MKNRHKLGHPHLLWDPSRIGGSIKSTQRRGPLKNHGARRFPTQQQHLRSHWGNHHWGHPTIIKIPYNGYITTMNLEINGDMNISQYGYILLSSSILLLLVILLLLYMRIYIYIYIYDSYDLSLDHGNVSITL